jgi:hypothetical protein
MYETQKGSDEMNSEDKEYESDSGKYSDEGHYTNTIYDERVNAEINDDETYSFCSETTHSTAMNKTAVQRRSLDNQEDSSPINNAQDPPNKRKR